LERIDARGVVVLEEVIDGLVLVLLPLALVSEVEGRGLE